MKHIWGLLFLGVTLAIPNYTTAENTEQDYHSGSVGELFGSDQSSCSEEGAGSCDRFKTEERRENDEPALLVNPKCLADATIQELPHGVPVIQLDDVLQPEYARQLADELDKQWERDDQWLYVANIPGTNTKERGNFDVEKRKERAAIAKEQGIFCYSKYELDRRNELYKTISKLFDSEGMRELVAGALDKAQWDGANRKEEEGEESPNKVAVTIDMFVSCYTDGDFLAAHDDFNLGSVAFTYYLNNIVDERAGGELIFHNGFFKRGRKVKDSDAFVRPKFNRMALFPTKPKQTYHEVLMTHDVEGQEKTRRYAITGWFVRKRDKLSDKDWEVVNKHAGGSY
eukprot:comp5116_c0_seq1/m.1190 comp5116_c0_seq1/g.1190  ORF comp5116_c0_seq1/g.1190 comp5116_c0_seq1/m.1190 type:complete len:342 (-) comp5116_c0_seq1:238-1263(-)